MWRDKTTDAVASLLDNYNRVSNSIVAYIELINVYFAPTTFETDLRRHIEGCIGWNLRNNYPDLKIFYPDDNHGGTKANRLGEKLTLILDEPIAGIDNELTI